MDFHEGLLHSALGLLPSLLATFLGHASLKVRKDMAVQIRGGPRVVLEAAQICLLQRAVPPAPASGPSSGHASLKPKYAA